jgi:hypothetical protein
VPVPQLKQIGAALSTLPAVRRAPSHAIHR